MELPLELPTLVPIRIWRCSLSTMLCSLNLNPTTRNYISTVDIVMTASSFDLVDQHNVAYLGPVFMGTPLQGSFDSNFVYDTGSGYLITTSTNMSYSLFSSQYYN